MSSLRGRRFGLGPRIAARGGSRRYARAFPMALAAAVTASTWPGGRGAQAVPIDDPHIGGIGFSGPTTGDLAAIYWNPAALGLIRGINLTFAGTGQLSTTTVSRASIDATGGVGPGTAFGDVRTTNRFQPIIWPPGPGAFAGISADVGGDRFTLAFAAYMPFLDRSSYQTAPGDALATRYHRISADLRNLALIPALSVRFAGDFRLGLAPGVVFSTGRLVFAETTCSVAQPCPFAEDPAADARVDVGSDLGILASKAAVTLGAGLYFRRRAWEFGFSFSSRPLGDVNGSAVIVGDQSQLTQPTRAGGQVVTCANGRADGRGCVFADIVYKLPYTLVGGVAWHPRAGWELAAIVRILSFPANDVIDIRLTGATLADTGVPAHIVLYRGYGTVVDTRLRAATWLTGQIRVGAGLRLESSALPDHAVSPGAVDGRKLQPTAMVLVRPIKHLWIAAGYGFTYMLPVTTASSVFDPAAAMQCTGTGGDLGPPNSPCLARAGGLARATAAGTYRHMQHDFSLSLTAEF